jgi:outer membrane protein OmpA-like peptidoglycan-associated protein
MKYFFGIYLLIIVFSTQAQTSANKKAQLDFDKAQQYLVDQVYDHAIESLNESVKADPNFQFAFIQLGDVYRKIKQYENAKLSYSQALSLGPLSEPRYYLNLADAYLNTGDYQKAKINYLAFLDKYTGKDQLLLSKCRKYLQDCDFSISAIKNPEKYELVNIGKGINSNYRDYFPSLTADGKTMIFSRNVEGNEDFYIAQKVSGNWQTAVPLSTNINTEQFNEGAQSISPDGMYLYFTGCNRPDGLGRCDLYVSHKNGKGWDVPFNLGPSVNSSYWDSQPAISPDGSILYFISNRPGGLGGYDIWKSTLDKEGIWSAPTNLGPEINTAFDENTPFIHPDGKTLYFSSDGWPGFGNKDIFYSRIRDDDTWGKPVNLGFPINTFNEETGLIVTPDGKEGLLSSNSRSGYGEMDIYSFKMPESARPKPITYVKGIVRDKESKQFLEAEIEIVNLKNNVRQYNDYTDEQNGEFLAVMPFGGNYAFNVSADDYLFYSQNFDLKQVVAGEPQLLEIYLEKIKIGTNVTLRNIFFDTNKFMLLPSSITELTRLRNLLSSHKNIQIEIQGHTDNVGNTSLNNQLSFERAKAVYNYLIENQIEAYRLTFKGYGQNKPLASNSSEQGRKQNRRTSFVITKT